MKKVRVAFFAEILIGDFDGAARTMFQLFDRIDAEKFEFLFICAKGPATLKGFECVQVPALKIPANDDYVLGMPGWNAKKLRARLDSFQPDLVHIATPSVLGHFGLNYGKSRKLPVTTIYHTHFISYIAYYFRKVPFLIKPVERLVQQMQNSFYNRCDKIYVPSVSIRKALVEGGISPDHMKIWKRGMDTKLFSPAKKDESYIQKLTGNTNPTILFASRLVWEKNMETLIGIYRILQQEGLRYNLLIVGDGVARKDCEARMPNATFTGELDHEKLSVLYASATVFVFPSISETFGNVVLEAMASGLVPVVADGGGSRDFIENQNGFKCAPNNAAEYVARFKEIIGNEQLRSEMSRNAIAYSKSYDWDALAKIYFSDLIELAQQSKQVAIET